MNTIAERVAAGAAFLDEHDPDWWKADVPNAIDLDGLDLGDGEICILGQRCPLTVLAGYCGLEPGQVGRAHRERSYIAYIRHLSGLTDRQTFAWAVNHGFNAAGPEPGDEEEREREYDALTAEWKRVITGRRAAS